GTGNTKPGTINSLIAEYYLCSAFTTKSLATQSTYRRQLEAFRNEYGHLPVAGLKTKHVDKILGDVAARSKSQAHNLRKRLLMIMAVAVTWEYRDDNPLLLASKIGYKDKGYRTWTEGDIAKYRMHWKTGTPQRLAFEILLNTGLRRSD